MLKILCCVKQVPDVDRMQMDPETGNLIRAGVPAILNPQDANALAAATQDSYDMIFCGKESLDGATGQMGAQLAQRFGAAQVTSTLLIKEVNEEVKTAVVERELEDGIETLEVKLPCLFTIEKQNYPARIPNLKGKMAAKKAAITTITSNDIPGLDRECIGDAGSPTKVPRMFPPVMPEPGVIIDEGSAEANSSKLLEIMKG